MQGRQGFALVLVQGEERCGDGPVGRRPCAVQGTEGSAEEEGQVHGCRGWRACSVLMVAPKPGPAGPALASTRCLGLLAWLSK